MTSLYERESRSISTLAHLRFYPLALTGGRLLAWLNRPSSNGGRQSRSSAEASFWHCHINRLITMFAATH